ncbi:hypothetical protein ACEN9J_37410 [Variovorax sp. Varisp41]|jgi:hypothetical protein|uniref:hypothetical protein n=1 Tax=unclassified Variovorax TaxID=663243 RepID=UPI000C51D330|nr:MULTISPECIES: hypothetical protein [unclassified Variovorax]MBS76392.1 hypothetical protein [Variovorax sp.]MCT8177845.1 hypothetical protein [Variovorax sp. CY25R-8]
MAPLRHLAVTVFQANANAFRWRLVELLPDGQWSVIEEQASTVKSYSAAMAAGLVRLQGMVEDLSVGPREEEADAPAAKAASGMFGFGFGLPK